MAIWPSPDRLGIDYLFEWFHYLDLATLVSGSSVPQLNKQDLAPLRISVPPFDLQRRFARDIAAVGDLKFAHRASLTQLDGLFASLQHRAFAGEI